MKLFADIKEIPFVYSPLNYARQNCHALVVIPSVNYAKKVVPLG